MSISASNTIISIYCSCFPLGGCIGSFSAGTLPFSGTFRLYRMPNIQVFKIVLLKLFSHLLYNYYLDQYLTLSGILSLYMPFEWSTGGLGFLFIVQVIY